MRAPRKRSAPTQTAMETFATDNSGSYSTATLAKLNGIEPTISTTACAGAANGCPVAPTVTASGKGYTVAFVAKTTGNTYRIVRADDGTLTYPCTVASATNAGGCSNLTGTTGTWN